MPNLDLKPPEDPYEFVDDDSLKNMSEEEQIAALTEWFHFNFEDPANGTPHDSAEGGYIYIWGGPFDAEDELRNRFEDLVPESSIDKAVDELERNCSDWAPAGRRIGPIHEDDEEPSPHDSEKSLRANMLRRLSELEHAIDEVGAASAGIGHNKPPEPIEDLPFFPAEIEIRLTILILREESNKADPATEQIERGAILFRDMAAKVRSWIARKCDIAADEAAKTFGKTIGLLVAAGIPASVAAMIYNLPATLIAATEAILNWLQHITPPF